jgi:hypothetical protein
MKKIYYLCTRIQTKINMEANKIQEKIVKTEEKIVKLEGTLSKYLVRLQKLYQQYVEAKELHEIIPVDIFMKFDTETYYNFKDEIAFEESLFKTYGRRYGFIHNQEASVWLTQNSVKFNKELVNTVYGLLYDANTLVDNIVNKREGIKVFRNTIDEYKAALSAANYKQNMVDELFKKVPMLKEFIEMCGEKQYAYLVNYNKKLQEKWNEYYKLDREACNLWNTGKRAEYEVKAKEARNSKPKAFVRSDEQIKDDVARWKENESRLMAERIKTEFGEVISTNFYLGDDGNVNGIIRGTKKTARIETIFAGGYNIQCLHTRLLVHEK